MIEVLEHNGKEELRQRSVVVLTCVNEVRIPLRRCTELLHDGSAFIKFGPATRMMLILTSPPESFAQHLPYKPRVCHSIAARVRLRLKR